jgi:hypothetical protein
MRKEAVQGTRWNRFSQGKEEEQCHSMGKEGTRTIQRRRRRKNRVTPWEEKEYRHSRGGGEGRIGSMGRRKENRVSLQKGKNRGSPEKEGNRVSL